VRFRESLASGRFAVALEITPPQKELPAVLLRRAGLLGDWAQAINVIQRPERQSSLAASRALCAAGFEPAWHLVTRGRTRAEIEDDLAEARAAGVGLILCILGDHAAAANTAGTPTIREVIATCREQVPGALIGATLNQYAPDHEAVMRNCLPKLKAGASYVQTQPVFDLAELEPLLRALETQSPATAVVAMAMPLLTAEAGKKIEARLNIRLPVRLREVLARGDVDQAWHEFDETLHALVESPLVDGVAIMTFEMDATPETGQRIGAALAKAGLAPG
jgi:5,10-methylenetetrahydrofolate reductase